MYVCVCVCGGGGGGGGVLERARGANKIMQISSKVFFSFNKYISIIIIYFKGIKFRGDGNWPSAVYMLLLRILNDSPSFFFKFPFLGSHTGQLGTKNFMFSKKQFFKGIYGFPKECTCLIIRDDKNVI